jgi:hypothetical protein
VVRRRRRWRVWQRHLRAAAFVFLDGTGATTAMVSRYGCGPRGERLVDAAPQGHWRTTTFVAGLRDTGIVAPLVLDGPVTGEVFRKHVEEILVPTLHAGDVVVSSTTWPRTRSRAGARRSSPPMPASSTCRPTRRISTRSSSCPPSSRRCCGRPPPAAVRRSGPPSATCSTPSAPTNAAAISPTAATRSCKKKML